MKKDCKAAYEKFKSVALAETREYIEALDYEQINNAAMLILSCVEKGGRVHVSGIGKCSYVAGYIASLMSSTGTPTYFLHGTEAVHGSCGQLRENDIVIFISNSGETAEMKAAITAIRNNGCKVIGVSGNVASWLALKSDVHLFAGVSEEGGPLCKAPRMSYLAETLVLQALSVILQEECGVTKEQYGKWHPGGKLGESCK